MKENPNFSPNQTAVALLIGPRYRFARHFAILSGLLLFLLSTGATRENNDAISYGRVLCIYVGFIIMLYTNIYLLLPLFFFSGKYLLYFGFLALTVYSVLLLISLVLDQYFARTMLAPDSLSHDREQLGLYTGGVICIAIILVSTAFKLFERWITDREKMSEMNNLALNLELDGLRNQINPHFLFNMLNNVKALIRIDPEKAAAVIMKLSEFLRYQLYDNKGMTASLQTELDFLFNLADLEKIRRDNLNIQILVHISPDQIAEISLPPNLFTNFIENAIKYSVDISGQREEVKIWVSLKEKTLRFTCTNTLGPDIWAAGGINSGLGLSNTKRRLELLYPETHSLEISATATAYTIDLKIPL